MDETDTHEQRAKRRANLRIVWRSRFVQRDRTHGRQPALLQGVSMPPMFPSTKDGGVLHHHDCVNQNCRGSVVHDVRNSRIRTAESELDSDWGAAAVLSARLRRALQIDLPNLHFLSGNSRASRNSRCSSCRSWFPAGLLPRSGNSRAWRNSRSEKNSTTDHTDHTD